MFKARGIMADRRIFVFQAVARLLNFTKAAETLHLTQPAVSAQVRQLEEHFNVKLLNRVHNRVTLTPAGIIVYKYANEILELYAKMDNVMQEYVGDDGRIIIIGASSTVAEYMLPLLLGDFNNKFPHVTIQLKISNTEDIVSMIEDTTIDFGIIESQINNKNLIVEPCHDDHLVVVVPPLHVLACCKKIGFNEILELPFISREENSSVRRIIDDYISNLTNCSVGLKIAMELASSEAVKSAVEAGMGISILPLAIIQKELRLGTLIGIALDPPLVRPFLFVYQQKTFRIHLINELLKQTRLYCAKYQTMFNV